MASYDIYIYIYFRLIIHKVLVEERGEMGEAEVTLDTEATIVCMKYLDTRLYAGTGNGTLLIYCRDQGQFIWLCSVVGFGLKPLVLIL